MAQMRHGYRDPLAATRRQHFFDRMKHQRDSMTGAEVEAAMEKIARERLAMGEDVTIPDFLRANLPDRLVKSSFERVKAKIKWGVA